MNTPKNFSYEIPLDSFVQAQALSAQIRHNIALLYVENIQLTEDEKALIRHAKMSVKTFTNAMQDPKIFDFYAQTVFPNSLERLEKILKNHTT